MFNNFTNFLLLVDFFLSFLFSLKLSKILQKFNMATLIMCWQKAMPTRYLTQKNRKILQCFFKYRTWVYMTNINVYIMFHIWKSKSSKKISSVLTNKKEYILFNYKLASGISESKHGCFMCMFTCVVCSNSGNSTNKF